MSKLQEALDFAIRDSEIKNDKTKFGYVINGKPYNNYLSKDAWKSFLKQMSVLHEAQYRDGNGGELEEKKGRYGLYPPKMASFGSSSRMIYEASKNIKGFVFEKQLPTRVGHIANLDGFLSKGCKKYVEAKCREIYDSHKTVKISNVYTKVYDFISENYEPFSYENNYAYKDEDYFNCTFKYKGEKIEHFDIKQLICHFLGIAADILENDNYMPVNFIYFIYNPEHIKDYIAEGFRHAIIDSYKATIEEIDQWNGFKDLFNTILEYQEQKYGPRKKEVEFEFTRADQSNYTQQFECPSSTDPIEEVHNAVRDAGFRIGD